MARARPCGTAIISAWSTGRIRADFGKIARPITVRWSSGWRTRDFETSNPARIDKNSVLSRKGLDNAAQGRVGAPWVRLAWHRYPERVESPETQTVFAPLGCCCVKQCSVP